MNQTTTTLTPTAWGLTDMDEIETELRKIIREELSIDPSVIGSDELLSDTGVDSDDISFLFIPVVEKRFSVRFSIKQWRKVGTINEIASMIRSTLKQ